MIHCKRYLATAGNRYYPEQAMGNFVGLFDTIPEAMKAAKGWEEFVCIGSRWASVFDLLTGKTVAHEDDWITEEWQNVFSQEIAEDGDKTSD